MKLTDWRVFGGTVELDRPHMQVSDVELEVMVRDTHSADPVNPANPLPIYITDLQFQPGHLKTGWVPNTEEFLDRVEFTINEDKNYGTSWTHAIPPRVWTPEELGYERLFNFMGRGHETIIFPNDLPEPEFWEEDALMSTYGRTDPFEILTTGINWVIVPKDDYDIVRISTDVGGPIPEEEFLYADLIETYGPDNPNTIESEFQNHPLNIRYSREFYMGPGLADDVIELNASIMTAKKNGIKYDKRPVRSFTMGGRTYKFHQNKFHLIPRGSVRFRVEFYKLTNIELRLKNENYDPDIAGSEEFFIHNKQYLKDVGIGYNGHVTFKQWTYGVERL